MQGREPDHGIVPAEAVTIAESYLQERWKDQAKQFPDAHGLRQDEDVASARLGQPFVIFKLAGDGLGQYLDAAENDPRGLATVVWYCFPIEFPEGETLGAVIVARNRDHAGHKFLSEEGEVTFLGTLPRSLDALSQIVVLRQKYREVCAIEFVDIGVGRFLVRDGRSQLLSGGSESTLRPLGDDANEIRERIREYREAFPASNEQ